MFQIYRYLHDPKPIFGHLAQNELICVGSINGSGDDFIGNPIGLFNIFNFHKYFFLNFKQNKMAQKSVIDVKLIVMEVLSQNLKLMELLKKRKWYNFLLLFKVSKTKFYQNATLKSRWFMILMKKCVNFSING